jgi:hypothetical protein
VFISIFNISPFFVLFFLLSLACARCSSVLYRMPAL